jgi:REP element-mobilizing transposase RayT
MSRTARRKSESGIYHVVLRGINRQTIFADDEDHEKFIQILSECKKISGYSLYGYCLMGNHVHLLIKEETEDLGKIMKRIGVRYVYWFNRKYGRSGHLFQDRFKSEPVDDDGYFMTVLRYIHQNPLKSGLTKSLEGYQWSSYNEYLGKPGITDIEFALSMVSREEFKTYMNEENHDTSMEIEDKKRLTDAELAERIIMNYKMKPLMLRNEPREEINRILRELLQQGDVSTRQLSRVTGISVNIIWSL